ncbi:hypothetical protein [Absidia glauca]|uniref:Uncharacterized protein n=1 Tax=Absidia glauca TaxID=4829 RepID=A0A168T8A0_ABSGL|nr:hypothetical protein [Absidia glauca]
MDIHFEKSQPAILCDKAGNIRMHKERRHTRYHCMACNTYITETQIIRAIHHLPEINTQSRPAKRHQPTGPEHYHRSPLDRQ